MYELCLEVAAVWKDPRLLYRPSDALPKTVNTSVEEGAWVLSKTKRAIRGAQGVKVDIREGKLEGPKLAEYWVKNALFDPWLYQDDAKIREARSPLNRKIEEVFSVIKAIPGLLERLFESFGHKHYEPSELTDLIRKELAEDSWLNTLSKLSLASSIGRALHSAGFQPERKEEFEGWVEVARLSACDFEALAVRTKSTYETFICLNAPLVDVDDQIPIAALQLRGEPVLVKIGAATDDDLARLLRAEPSTPVGQINTLVTYQFSVGIDASVDEYQRHYSAATLIAERITDILRLISEDDVGVLGLEIRGVDWATSIIRKTYETTYQVDLAPYQPKRFRFGPATEQILTEEQIQKLCELAPPYICDDIPVRGLATAIRRFRATFDRYEPSDPERLLEMAIAFEAVLLNDMGEKQELGYRLRLRAARLLAEDMVERERVFEVLRDLYAFRSRIAHGETLQDIKGKDRARLETVIQETPRILRKLLLRMMEEEGLRGAAPKELALWWRRLELG